MSYVTLADLLAPDKNFHGLLDGAVVYKVLADEYCLIKYPDLDKAIMPIRQFVEEFPAVTDTVEWGLFPDGGVSWWGPSEGWKGVLRPLTLDISDWLRTLPVDHLEKIGHHMLQEWDRGRPGYITHYLGERVVNVKKLTEFVDRFSGGR